MSSDKDTIADKILRRLEKFRGDLQTVKERIKNPPAPKVDPKYHPNGKCDEINLECPACQKVLDKIEREALAMCQDKESQSELEQNFAKIMLERFGYEVTFVKDEERL